MCGTAPDGAHVQLLVREARNGLALSQGMGQPAGKLHVTKPAPSWSQGDEWVHGHTILTPSSGLHRQHSQSILPILGFPKAVVISLPLHIFPFLWF